MRFPIMLLLLVPFFAVLASCGSDSGEQSTTERALADLQRRYDELVDGMDSDPVQWATEDLGNIGDWEYRVERIGDESPEALVASLNALGDERWEVFWMERSRSGLVVYLKRSAVSYLGRVPLSALGRLIPNGAGGEQ